jgi:hypothetical protein
MTTLRVKMYLHRTNYGNSMLWANTIDRNSNLVVPPIPAIAVIDQTLYTLFGDYIYVASLAGYTPIP